MVFIIYKHSSVWKKIRKSSLTGRADEQCGPKEDTDPRRFQTLTEAHLAATSG
jgi:hypothetical protein